MPRSRLGLRSIRLTLKRRELLRSQLRALVRAAAHGDLRVMFPFVSGIEELREARSVLAEARQEIEARGVASGRSPGRRHDRGAVGRVHGRSARG